MRNISKSIFKYFKYLTTQIKHIKHIKMKRFEDYIHIDQENILNVFIYGNF
jgi:hypothetical protein